MSESAISLREQKKVATAHRITHAAQVLAEQHGLDGFTMEDLAEAADVSRRTLFNYFASKTDAVLGPEPEVPERDVAAFRAGGPHGTLIDDLAELARTALSTKQLDRPTVERARRLLVSEPRLLAAAHHRFETITADFTDLVLEREGAGFDPARARLLLRLVLALFDVALDAFTAGDRTLVEAFDDQLAAARELLG
ncbi:TetR family transcriptional regulator [Nocardioides sp. MAH-18]|uniref:TetR family transcriptional regulator n=1 Tax=Nocardioides agri TaxID=2682843 RepID=A0A6L6XT44_9ACTN|nr:MULTISPECIES: TetR/AcrR family transcriptional regulator [unclassified Nocardioides]MBA2955119.1 TetR/AcrR family transcriptional regulator [Nocardioides sp. CGMCC 1.13656]MVQ49972.1 TetR family transcriptional regulator [Nocardioides sp. MAH-18]